jgi:hypothetical protein
MHKLANKLSSERDDNKRAKTFLLKANSELKLASANELNSVSFVE